jgi:hypothetical protein
VEAARPNFWGSPAPTTSRDHAEIPELPLYRRSVL